MTRPRGIPRRFCTIAGSAAIVVAVPVTAAMAQSSATAQSASPRASASRFGEPPPRVLSLRAAIERGLAYNLSLIRVAQAVRQAEGQRGVARSALQPNITGSLQNSEQRINLAAFGIQFDIPIPGVTVPSVVGPFNLTDVRARVSQSIIDLAALNNYRAAREVVGASELAASDSRDAIVLAVGTVYLQAIAARARAEAARAQIDTAAVLQRNATRQRSAGLATPLDVNRFEVQLLTQQQRLVAFQAAFAKQKIDLARMIGLSPTDDYDLANDVAFAAAPRLALDEALEQAVAGRADLQAAQAQVRAAELALAAARAERKPSLSVSGDYGASRAEGTPTSQTYFIGATLRVPIWEGGRSDGRIEQADATLRQRRAELEDLRADIEADVRKAFLDLQAAVRQVEAADAQLRVNTDNLALTRQRFDAGVSDNLAVVQSQELVAAAQLDRISAILAHNMAKLDLARAIGRAAEDFVAFMGLP
jgi:outer membrane protein TolC